MGSRPDLTPALWPDFLIVGAAKAGTTSLFRYLGQHPQVFTPVVKEPNYFCRPQGLYARSDQEYAALFANRQPGQHAGEASVTYLFDEGAPMRIGELLGSPKILILLRNPADRAFSQWSFNFNRGEESLAFDQALAAEPERMRSTAFHAACHGHPWFYFYFQTGCYATQVERYLRAFGRQQVRVYLFEKFVRDPATVCAQVYRFLNIDADFTPSFEVHNRQATFRSGRLKRLLSTSRPAWLEAGFRILPIAMRMRVFALSRKLYWANMKETSKNPYPPELRRELLNRYRPEIERLSKLLEMDLSFWWDEHSLTMQS